MAGDMNRATLIGRLGGDPEVRNLDRGGRVVSFSMATSESWRDKETGERKERTQWHRVVIWNEGLGKIAEQYLRKGSKCLIEGTIETREFTDRDDVKKRITEIVLRNFDGKLLLQGDKQGGGDSRRRDDRDRDYGSDGGDRDGRSQGSGSGYRGGGYGSSAEDDIPFAPEWR